MEITLGSILGAAIPSLVIGIIGYFARRTLDAIELGVAKVNERLEHIEDRVSAQAAEFAALKATVAAYEGRIAALERDVQVRRSRR